MPRKIIRTKHEDSYFEDLTQAKLNTIKYNTSIPIRGRLYIYKEVYVKSLLKK